MSRDETRQEMRMFPWFWFWAPRFNYPWSGNVAQDISPDTTWFFGAIKPQAGIGDVEKEIFDVASYGRQLGLITEVLLSLASADTIDAAKATESLTRLKAIYAEIESVKAENSRRLAEATMAMLRTLRARDPDAFTRVLRESEAGSEA
jgi:hypothetical protein